MFTSSADSTKIDPSKTIIYIPMFIGSRYGDLSNDEDVLKAAEEYGSTAISENHLIQEPVDFGRIANILTASMKKYLSQVGETAMEAHQIVEQHSWYKRHLGYMLIKTMVDKSSISEKQSERDLTSPNVLNAGTKKFTILNKGTQIQEKDILELTAHDLRLRIQILKKAFNQNAGKTIDLVQLKEEKYVIPGR